MSNFEDNITKNYFLFLVLVITIHLIQSNPNKVPQECHLEIYTQSMDRKESPKRLENVDATLLSDKPDCSIFRVKNNGQNLNPKDLFTQADKVVKIVRMEIKDGQNRKSMDLLAHEVDMFQLVRKRRSKEVIKIYDSKVFSETIYIKMEMGEFDLKQKLERMKNKWNEVGHKSTAAEMKNDIYTIIEDMATVLADFNRYAIHFALKTENWVYVKNGYGPLKLKLIDLQTAATTVGGKVLNPQEQRVYFCKERKDEAFVPTHASPEHIKFCKNKKKDLPKHDSQQHQQNAPETPSPELTAKADIWSMGVLICEILAITPIFLDEYGYEILKAVFVPMPSIETSTDGTRENGTKLKEEDILKGLKSKIAGRVFMAQPKVKRKSQQQELLSVQEVKIAEQIVKDHKMNIAEVGMLDDAEEEVLNDEEMEMLKQMLAEKKLKEEEEIGKKTKVEKARQNLLIHFPAIYKLLEEIFQEEAKYRPAPKAIKEYIKKIRLAKGDAEIVKTALGHKFPQKANLPRYVRRDWIKKVQREYNHFLKWRISGVDKMTFCKYCFFVPNYAKSAEDGGSVKKIDLEEETHENVTNKMPDSPRNNSNIVAVTITRKKSVKKSAEKEGSVTNRMLSPRNLSDTIFNALISPRRSSTVVPIDHSIAIVA